MNRRVGIVVEAMPFFKCGLVIVKQTERRIEKNWGVLRVGILKCSILADGVFLKTTSNGDEGNE